MVSKKDEPLTYSFKELTVSRAIDPEIEISSDFPVGFYFHEINTYNWRKEEPESVRGYIFQVIKHKEKYAYVPVDTIYLYKTIDNDTNEFVPGVIRVLDTITSGISFFETKEAEIEAFEKIKKESAEYMERRKKEKDSEDW